QQRHHEDRALCRRRGSVPRRLRPAPEEVEQGAEPRPPVLRRLQPGLPGIVRTAPLILLPVCRGERASCPPPGAGGTPALLLAGRHETGTSGMKWRAVAP